MNTIEQEKINTALLNYCEKLEKKSHEQSEKMDLLLDILTEVAKRIAK